MWQSLSSSDALGQLRVDLESGHRGLVSLTGTLDWALDRARQLFDWADLDVCKYSSLNQDLIPGVLSPAVAYQYLGRQFDGLFFDLSLGLKPDALAALVGCVGGGGLVCLYWGSTLETHPIEAHLLLEGRTRFAIGHRLRERLLCSAMGGQHYHLNETADELKLSGYSRPTKVSSNLVWTQDQVQTLEAVVKVTMGRRRRPLLIEAPRGRGKSTLLAEAIIKTLSQKTGDVLVVMPHAFSALPLVKGLEAHWSCTFEFGVRHQLSEATTLTLLTMEQVLSTTHVGDMIFVDEAACFPIHVLLRFVSQTSRIIFSTTTAGYEGTGQGFRLRFDHQLKARYPDRRRVEMDMPVRWQAGDPVESWLNDAFCLMPDLIDCVPSDAPVEIELVSQDTLVQDTVRLQAVYGLLVRAHHRTTPGDLQRILDAPNIMICVARSGESVLGVCVVAEEGGLASELVEPIYEGRRRPKGHFLPETLSVHAGVKEAVRHRYWRIVRVAVDGRNRRRGIGDRLLRFVETQAVTEHIDILGASFGATEPLISFWRHAEYDVVRIGIKRGRSSGLYSAVVLSAVSDAGASLVERLRHRYRRYFPDCLGEGLRTLEWSVARSLFQERGQIDPNVLDPLDLSDLESFVAGRQSFEIVSPSVKRALLPLLSNPKSARIADEHWAFVIEKVFQHRPWRDMMFNGKNLDSRGLAHGQLRKTVGLFVTR